MRRVHFRNSKIAFQAADSHRVNLAAACVALKSRKLGSAVIDSLTGAVARFSGCFNLLPQRDLRGATGQVAAGAAYGGLLNLSDDHKETILQNVRRLLEEIQKGRKFK